MVPVHLALAAGPLLPELEARGAVVERLYHAAAEEFQCQFWQGESDEVEELCLSRRMPGFGDEGEAAQQFGAFGESTRF